MMKVSTTDRQDVPSFLSDKQLFCTQCFIDGQWVDANKGTMMPVTNPATGEILGAVPKMGASETAHAISAASAALPVWRAKTAKERAVVLRKWFDLMVASQEDLARLMTAEQGKPLAEARGEVAYAASFLEWFAEEGKRVYGDVIPGHQADKRILVIKEPVGVCAAITPWNFPSAMITRKAAPALAAGCTIVLKPASATPFSALALAKLAERAGVPKGVFNVVTGGSEAIGRELAENPLVRKLTFTGSTEVGKSLMRQCAGTVKKISLELGGHAPFIVFADADPDAAIEGALQSKYRNAGQTCVCANRILIQESIYSLFTERFVERVRMLRLGNGMDAGVTVGPMIDEASIVKVEDQISDAVKKGARILTGGKRHPFGDLFFEPTVLGNVGSDMKITREETFGPVAPLYSFRTDEEAVAMANDTPFGLAAYLYSRDIQRIWRMAEALEYGILGINTGIISAESAPFGGMKESGIGREGGKYGIEEFLEIKYLCLGEI
ncbi:MAG TPA: NAD-dependent succinate-semialdehyde dehydrogenase [Smithellaceae bacterium]|nr:NAD-dependent succinate-semialdehyde dehydrogenase [Smithellaceae bacterium]